MSRAQDTQVFNQGTDQATQNNANAQGAFGTASAGYGAELAHPGYSPEVQANIKSSANDANNAAYDSAATKGLNQVAATRNDAGTNALLDKLARGRAETAANAQMAANEQIGQSQIQGTQNALGGFSGLFGTAGGQGNQQLNTAQSAAAANKGFWDTFGESAANALGKSIGTFGGSTGGGGSSAYFG